MEDIKNKINASDLTLDQLRSIRKHVINEIERCKELKESHERSMEPVKNMNNRPYL